VVRPTPRAVPASAVQQLPHRWQRWVVALFFGALLLVGWRLVPDYGSYYDEATCRESGQISLVYLYECVPARWLPARAAERLASTPPQGRLLQYRDRDYGVAFELPMTLLEKASGYTDMHDVLLLRHRSVFVVCWLGCWAVYWLASQRFGSRWLGLLAVALLVLSPRLFADFFYNAKDAVFLACFAIGTATTVAFVRHPSGWHATAHALACAVAIGVRPMAVLLPAATIGLLALRGLHGDYTGQSRRIGSTAMLYLGLLVAFTIACWPYLWSSPATHFWESLHNMSRFRWQGVLLYSGRWLPPGAQTPWTYAPEWIGITTPLLYLLGLAISLGLLVWQLWRRGWRLYGSDGEWQDLLLWGLTLGPLVAVAVLHSVLYDGWRQLYFVYPSLLLLALRGLVAAWLWQPPRAVLAPYWRGMVGAALLASAIVTGTKMVELHPLENLYFNILAGSHPEQRYEYDYWGLSFPQGLRWILAHDARPTIQVQANLVASCITGGYLLAPAEQQRLRVDFALTPVDYFITTHRAHPGPYPAAIGLPVYTLRADDEGRRVFDIYRVNRAYPLKKLLAGLLDSTAVTPTVHP
jgi:hypothetical protein